MTVPAAIASGVGIAELLGVEAMQVAFSHLPAERLVRALLLADTAALGSWLLELIADNRRYARAQGHTEGWDACEGSVADAWTPVAERVRRDAGVPAFEELLVRRGEVESSPGHYRTIPRPTDRTGRQMVAEARASWVRWTHDQNRGAA